MMPVEAFAGLPLVTQAEGQTELTNARRLVALYGHNMRFCHQWNKWLNWDGTRWQIDNSGGAMNHAKGVADAVWSEAQEHNDDSARRFAGKSASDKSCKAMLSLAQSERPVDPDELDQNEWLLNVLNGTLDLRTGVLREHLREDYITRLCPTNFNPDACSTQWDKFLDSIFSGDVQLIEFVQRFFGCALTGSVQEQVLPIAYGTGANGKTTLFNAFMETIGPDYCIKVAAELIVSQKPGHSTERMDLAGKRFALCSETDDGHRLAESFVKDLTGSERIRGRRMREDTWEYQPTHKLVLATNHKPRVTGTDHGIWRRICLIPFNVRFEGDNQDKALPEKLRAEREGILAWAVRGCAAWQERGSLDPPPAVLAATAEYRSESDVIGRFIDERCIRHQAVRVKFKQLSAEFERWCQENGEKQPSSRKLGQYLQDNGFEPQQSGCRWYIGIAIRESENGTME